MKIKFLEQVVGPHGVYNPDTIHEHPDADARRLIDAGVAVAVDESVGNLVETATVAAQRKVKVRRITRENAE